MKNDKIQFNLYVHKSDIKRFKKMTQNRAFSQAYLFGKALDLLEEDEKASKSRRYVASNTPVKCPQTAQERSGRAQKGGVMVSDAEREEGAK